MRLGLRFLAIIVATSLGSPAIGSPAIGSPSLDAVNRTSERPISVKLPADRYLSTGRTAIAGARRTGSLRGAINTHDKQAVTKAYRRRFAPNLTIPIKWTGNTAHCKAGKPSAKAQKATLESINFVRAMGGLAPVTFDSTLSHKAQKAALIMAANNELDHYPPRHWKCWTKAGYQAAHHSNLAYSYPSITAGGLVSQYMGDDGDTNLAVGHRRWVLYPPTTTMGSGTTTTTNALWVVGPTSQSRPDPTFVGWPTAGWFPAPMEPHGRWSLSSGNIDADFSKATVKVTTVGGKRVNAHRYAPEVGYGQPTLVWHVSGIQADRTYKVVVRHIVIDGTRVSHSYTVRLFSPSRDAARFMPLASDQPIRRARRAR